MKTRHDPIGMTKNKIVIVDDHPMFREGIAQFINRERDLEVAGEASSADEAMTLLENAEPDLMVVDITLKSSNGLDLIKNLKSRYENLKVLVISMHDETLYAERALRAGARGYIMKQEVAQNIMTAIRRILDGKVYLSEAMMEKMLEKKIQGVPSEKSAVSLLSDRELEVFQFIGEGVPTSDIAKNLHLSVKTIETYRANIKTKLNLKNNTELVRHAIQWVQEDHEN